LSNRRRVFCVVALPIVIAAGLATRSHGECLPAVVATYGGDTLWALALFLTLALVFVSWSRTRLALVAYGLSCIVEVSQFAHPRWLDALRRTRLGALLLGYEFLWSDLVCYAVGVALGVALDVLVVGPETGSSRQEAAPRA